MPLAKTLDFLERKGYLEGSCWI